MRTTGPMPRDQPHTLLMELLDGDESLHQLGKGRGDGAPALYGFIKLMHLKEHVGPERTAQAADQRPASLSPRRPEPLSLCTQRIPGEHRGRDGREALPDLALRVCVLHRGLVLGDLIHLSQDTLKAKVLRVRGHPGLPKSQATQDPRGTPLSTHSA